MLCVVSNTVVLALDGIIDTKESTICSALNLIFAIIFGKKYFLFLNI